MAKLYRRGARWRAAACVAWLIGVLAVIALSAGPASGAGAGATPLCNPVSLAPAATIPPNRRVVLLQGVNSDGDANEFWKHLPNQPSLIDALWSAGVPTESVLVFSYSDSYRPLQPSGTTRRGHIDVRRARADRDALVPTATYDPLVPTRQHPAKTMQYLTNLLREQLRDDPAAEFDLIGFSLGGFIASYWAASMVASMSATQGNPLAEGLMDRIHAIITVDSPLGGSPYIHMPDLGPLLIKLGYAAEWLKTDSQEVKLIQEHAPLELMTTIRATDDLVSPSGLATVFRRAKIVKQDCQIEFTPKLATCTDLWDPTTLIGLVPEIPLVGGVLDVLTESWIECAQKTHDVVPQMEIRAEVLRALRTPRVSATMSQTTTRLTNDAAGPAPDPGDAGRAPNQPGIPGLAPLGGPAGGAVAIPVLPLPPPEGRPLGGPIPLPLPPCQALPNPFDPAPLCPTSSRVLVASGVLLGGAILAAGLGLALPFVGTTTATVIAGLALKAVIGAAVEIASCQLADLILTGSVRIAPDIAQCAAVGAISGLLGGAAGAILRAPAGVAPRLISRLRKVDRARAVADGVGQLARVGSAVVRRITGSSRARAAVGAVKAAASVVSRVVRGAASAASGAAQRVVSGVRNLIGRVTPSRTPPAGSGRPASSSGKRR